MRGKAKGNIQKLLKCVHLKSMSRDVLLSTCVSGFDAEDVKVRLREHFLISDEIIKSAERQ